MARLVPIDYDPFAESTGEARLVPVDYDPFDVAAEHRRRRERGEAMTRDPRDVRAEERRREGQEDIDSARAYLDDHIERGRLGVADERPAPVRPSVGEGLIEEPEDIHDLPGMEDARQRREISEIYGTRENDSGLETGSGRRLPLARRDPQDEYVMGVIPGTVSRQREVPHSDNLEESLVKARQNLDDMMGRSLGGMIEAVPRLRQEMIDMGSGGLNEALRMAGADADDTPITRETDAQIRAAGRGIFDRASAELRRNAPNNASFGAQAAYDIFNGFVDLGVSVGVAAATRSPTLGSAVIGVRVFGDQYGEALSRGASEEQAFLEASLYSSAEFLGERVVVGRILRGAGGESLLGRVANGALSEGIQESVTEGLQIAVDAGIVGEDMTLTEALGRMAYSGMIGAAVGGPIGAITPATMAEEAAAEPVNITPEDIASPYPTDLIAEGKAAAAAAVAGVDADEILDRELGSQAGSTVAVDIGGQVRRGTVADAFTDEDGEQGAVIDWSDGTQTRERFVDLQDAGAKIDRVAEPDPEPEPEVTVSEPRQRPEVRDTGHRMANDVIEYLVGAGIDENVAAGVAAGIAAESNNDERARNPTSGALGLGQWLGSRQDELRRRYGDNPTRQQQLEFLLWELRGGDHGGRAVLDSRTPEEALDNYIRRFMRPAEGAETDGDLARGRSALAGGGIDVTGGSTSSPPGETLESDYSSIREGELGMDDEPATTSVAEEASTQPELPPVNEAGIVQGGGVLDRMFRGGERTFATQKEAGLWLTSNRLAGDFDITPTENGNRFRLVQRARAGDGDGTRTAPVNVATAEDVTRAATNAAEPTEAQAEAGNYAKGHIKLQGMDITIENPKGSTRSGVDPDGKPWSVTMPTHYGYVKRTNGADGEQVDVYVGPEPTSLRAFVVDQVDAETGAFDEHKIMLGYRSKDEALADYRAAFSDGKGDQRIGAVTGISTPGLQAWLMLPQTGPMGQIGSYTLAPQAPASETGASGPTQRAPEGTAPAASERPDAPRGRADQGVWDEVVRAFHADRAVIDKATKSRSGGQMNVKFDNMRKEGLFAALRGKPRRAPDTADYAADSWLGGYDFAARERIQRERPILSEKARLVPMTDEQKAISEGRPLSRNEKIIVTQNRLRGSGFSVMLNQLGELRLTESGKMKSGELIATPREVAEDIDAALAKAEQIVADANGTTGTPDRGSGPDLARRAKNVGIERLPNEKTSAFAERIMAAESAAPERTPKDIGAEDFAKGEPRVPPSALSTSDQKEWLAGWDKANLAAPVSSTAPEHAAVGVDDRELSEVVTSFDEVLASQGVGDEQITHVFDPPAKKDIVRLNAKARAYHKDHGWMTAEEAAAKIREWEAHAVAQGKDLKDRSANSERVVLSFFDLSGVWSEPWEQAGYQVWRFDIQADPEMGDVNKFSTEFFNDWFGSFDGLDIYAILAACPCTDFASSGNKHFAAKDKDGRTVASVKLVQKTLAAIEYFKPAVWALENPVGRIESLGGLPPWRLSFDPWAIGEDYTKKTLIWGRFNADLPVAPRPGTEADGGKGSKMWSQYGGKSLATKNARSVTPEGFAYSFFMANNAIDHPAMAIAHKYDRLDSDLIEQAVAAGVTEEQIDDAVEDLYYMELDDEAANDAIRELISGGDQSPGAPLDDGPISRAVTVEAEAEVILDKAEPLQALLVAWSKKSAWGDYFSNPGLKSKTRIVEKVLTENYPNAMALKDIVRGGFMVETPEQAEALAKAIGERFNIVQDKGWQLVNGGYFDHKLIIQFNDGIRGEIQIVPDSVWKTKKNAADSLYQDWRTEADRNGRESARAVDLERQMEALYAKALEGGAFESLASEVRSASGNSRAASERESVTPSLEMRPGAPPQAPPSQTTAQGRPAKTPVAASRPSISKSNTGTSDSDIGAGASSNKIFTDDAYEAARARMRDRMNRLSSGVDPEMLLDGAIMAGYHIEKGARSFAAYAKAMIADLGDSITPYLRSFYEAIRYDPRAAEWAGDMSSPEEIGATLATLATQAEAPISESETDDAVTATPSPARSADKAGDEGQGAGNVPRAGARGEPVVSGDEQGGDGRGNLRPADERPVRDPEEESTGSDAGDRVAAERGGRAGNRGRNRVRAKRAGRGTNYTAPVGSLKREGGWKATAERNLDIVELVNKLEAEGRPATTEEQALLAKFTGWGAGEIRNNLFRNVSRNAATGERTLQPVYWGEWKDLSERAAKLLKGSALETALQSTQYAHYTSEAVIRSMWAGMNRLGFTGGKVLEPGMGIGLFMVAAPNDVMAASSYTGIELDDFTAKVAGYLLPQENTLQADYVKSKLPDGFFDVAIGNPPFADVTILDDPAYKKHRLSLHDYFFAKTIDKVRPGGLMVFVTSRYTMDKVRDKGRTYLADRADLLGAIRLPQTAFKQNAGTEVVTDVLFFQRRMPDAAPGGEKWLGLGEVQINGQPQLINEYFVAHPEMVLGTHAQTGSMYRENEYTVEPLEGEIADHFARAVKSLPQDVYVEKVESGLESARAKTWEADMRPASEKEGGLYVGDKGKLYVRENGVGKPVEAFDKVTPADHVWLKDYIGLREALKAAQKDQLLEGDWETSLKALNRAYTSFVRKHGPISAFTTYERKTNDDDGNPQISQYRRFKNERLLRLDVESLLVEQLEKITDDGDIVKGRFLEGRTLNKPTRPKIESARDGLAVNLDELGRLDLNYIAGLSGMDRDAVIEELGDSIYETPSGEWQTSDEYLSGDVLVKLEEAKIAANEDERFERNVRALTAVQPKPLGPQDITVKLGAGWVPVDVVKKFAQDVLRFAADDLIYEPATAEWAMNMKGTQRARDATADFGTSDRSPQELMVAVLNNQSIKVVRRNSDGSTFTDQEATAAANEIAKQMIERFRAWVWEDSKRTAELLDLYNRRFNNIAPRKFDGRHLTLPGLSTKWKTHDHVKRAVWRQIQTGNTYLAHAVGAGKTLEMIIGAMEQKRLGLIKKPMFVVPNHMLNQFAREFMEAYPAAQVMVADEHAFHTDNRRRFMAQASLNDPDAIIITHSSFGKLGTKDESRQAVINQMIFELESALAASETRYTRAKIEKQIEALTRSVESRMGGAKDQQLTFEDMGVDMLYIDEAHEFRKLDFTTSRTVKGIDPKGSQKALDLYVKTRWLETQNPGRNLVMASGTPVTNTMAELYTVMRYMAEAGLEADGLRAFDAWANMFGEVAPGYEINAAGKYELVERFSRFVNVPELMKRVRNFMDVLTGEQLGDLVKRPKVKGGVPESVITPPIPTLQTYMKGELAERIERSKRWKPSKDQPANPDPIIAINTDARLASIDMRFIDNEGINDKGSKLNVMIDKIVDIHKRIRNDVFIDPATGNKELVKGGVQIVFSAVGFGEGAMKTRGFDLRKHLDSRLMKEAGLKKSQIAWMSDYSSHAKKEQLQKDVRAGKVKVLIGSPQNMGTGLNVQRRLRALHYLAPPWFPSDVEQPQGRIIRQGNLNEEVELYWYATKGTYDSSGWSMVSRKAKFIEQALSGDDSVRKIEDVSEANQYEMAAALAAGDDRVIQVASLSSDIERLSRLEGAHHQQQRELTSTKRQLTKYEIPDEEKRVAEAEAAEKERDANAPFGITIDGVTYNKHGEAGDALLAKLNAVWPDWTGKKPIQLGTFQGKHPISLNPTEYGKEKTGQIIVTVGDMALGTPAFDDPVNSFEGIGLAQRLVNAVQRIPSELRGAQHRLQEHKDEIARIERKLGTPFPQAAELAEKVAERARIQAELAAESAAPNELAQSVTRRDFLAGAAATAGGFMWGGKLYARPPALLDMLRPSLNGPINLAEPLRWMAQNSANPRFRALAAKIAPLVDGIELRSATSEYPFHGDPNLNGPAVPSNIIYGNAYGVFRTSALGVDQVWLGVSRERGSHGDSLDGHNERTLIHEALHAALVSRYGRISIRAAGNSPELLRSEGLTREAVPRPRLEAEFNRLRRIWRRAFDAYEATTADRGDVFSEANQTLGNAFSTPDEMLSWAIESPDVQAFLRTVPADPNDLSGKSAWDRFVDWINSLFGGGAAQRTALDDVLDAVNRLLDESQGVPRLPPGMGEREQSKLLQAQPRNAAPIVVTDEQAAAVAAQLQTELEKMGIADRVTLNVAKGLLADEQAQGSYWKRVIQVSLGQSLNPGATMRHEGYHALKALGLINKTEHTSIVNAAMNDKGVMKFVMDGYFNASMNVQQEEAAAEYYARWATARAEAKGFVAKAFIRIRDFLEAVRNAWEWVHARSPTAYTTMRRIEKGIIGRREEGSGAFEEDDWKFQAADEQMMFMARPSATMWNEMLNGARTLTGAAKTPGKREKISDALDRFRTAVQDRMLPMLRAQTAIEAAIGRILTDKENPYRAEELMSGRVGSKLERLEREMVNPLFEAMREEKIGIDEFESYLYARHAPERNAHISKINPDFAPGEGSGMTDIQAAAIMRRITKEGQMPAMKALAAKVDELVKFALETRLNAGLLSQDAVDELRKRWKHYVPLRGFAEVEGYDPGPRSGRGVTVRGPESKMAFGRRSAAEDILAHVVMQAEEAIFRAEKNRVAQQFYSLAQANPDKDFWKLHKVTMRKELDPDTGLKRDVLVTKMQEGDEPYTVMLKIGGKPKRVTMNRSNPAARRVAEAMRRLEEQQVNALIGFLSKVNRYLSAVNTSLNPEFVITNAFRDFQTAAVNLAGLDVKGLESRTLKDWRKAWFAATKGAFGRDDGGEWAKWWKEFTDEGGRVFYNQMQTLNDLKGELDGRFTRAAALAKAGRERTPKELYMIAKGDLKAVIDYIENVNLGIENAIRLSAYKNARELGVSKAEAASIAKNLTVNFNRRGTWGVVLNSLYLFANASIQGSTRILLAMKHRRVQKIVAGIVVAGMLQELLNMMLADDDDDGESEYDKISDFEKSRNMIFMVKGPWGDYIKLPMPWGYNAFHRLGRGMIEMARGRPPARVMGDMATTFIDAFNPIGGSDNLVSILSPTLFDPVVDLERNRDFAGRPIMPEQRQFGPETPNNQRYWSSVGPQWKAVTDFLNSATGGDEITPGAIDMSPEVLEHLFGVVTGATGAFLDRTLGAPMKAFDGDPETTLTSNDIPFVRKVVGEVPDYYDRAAFYSRVEQIEQSAAYARGYRQRGDRAGLREYVEEHRDELRMSPVVKQAKREMRRINEARDDLEIARDRGRVSGARYRELRGRLRDREQAVFDAFNRVYLTTVDDPVSPTR